MLAILPEDAKYSKHCRRHRIASIYITSKDRRGLILGEGGAMLVLEPLAAARARSARIHAEVVGFGVSSDAHHLTHLSIDVPVRAMRAALLDARLRPEQVDYINARSGTLVNDLLETRAIREFFGAHADRLAVSSTKSLHGHARGATGAMEAECTVLALENGLLSPPGNFTVPDPDCNLDVVPNRACTAQVQFALSNSFAFGGSQRRSGVPRPGQLTRLGN
jgi:nodulation protein E